MTIKPGSGNLLLAQVEALVNTVNTVGVAGKGIALQFRQAFPDNFKMYERAAKRGEVEPGQMFVTPTGQIQAPHYIVNFPTKRHWREASRIEDIEAGLQDLVRVIGEYDMSSIAVPPLGCGNGGLEWEDVRPLILRYLEPLTSVDVLLYAPSGAPSPDEMPIRTRRPPMTLGRAVLLMLLKQYRDADDFRLTALEVQKLAYFLQVAGQPLRLNYVKAKYGPYAENLNHVLRTLDGHYTSGYGDRSEEPRIKLLRDAAAEARSFLVGHAETLARLERVSELVRDWESPYSLELLATTHWALTHNAGTPTRQEVYDFVSSWTARKANLFKSRQIDRAIDRLVSHKFTEAV